MRRDCDGVYRIKYIELEFALTLGNNFLCITSNKYQIV